MSARKRRSSVKVSSADFAVEYRGGGGVLQAEFAGESRDRLRPVDVVHHRRHDAQFRDA